MAKTNNAPLKLAILLASSITLFFSSCEKDIEESASAQGLQMISEEIQTYFISPDLAAGIAYNIDRDKFPSGLPDDGSGDGGEIVTPPDNPDYFTLYDKDSIPALYIFSFGDNKGFAVISADFRYDPVCAVVPLGSGLHKGDTIPSALDSWISATIEDIEIVRAGEYENLENATFLWGQYEPVFELMGYLPPEQYIPEPDCGPITEYIAGPLLGPIHWGQGCTFKEKIEADVSCSGCSPQPLTGCVATAMAQIIKYWQYPSNYTYSLMPDSFGNSQVQYLMWDCAESVKTVYGCDGSSADMNKVDNALKDDFNYNSASFSDYDFSVAKSNILSNKPVILGGFHSRSRHGFLFIKWYRYEGGHTWVADGIRRTGNNCSSGNFIHMNWGWREVNSSDYFNGWFTPTFWDIPAAGRSYQFSKDMVYNINP